MKPGLWCEVLVPSALLAAWIAPVHASPVHASPVHASPVHASCVQCPLLTHGQQAIADLSNLANVNQAAKQLAPFSVTLPEPAMLGTMPLVQPSPQPSAIEFTSTLTELAHPNTPIASAETPLLILSEKQLTHTPPKPSQPAGSTHIDRFDVAQAFPVSKIVVTGNTTIPEADITAITQKLEGTTVTLSQLQGAADEITQLYLDRGYITSRAIVPANQTVTDGVVTIQVVEGGLQRIDVEGNRRVNTDYIRSRIALGGIAPLRQDRLEDQLRLLRSDLLFENVEASLKAGDELGKSILTVRVVEASPFFANLSADNFSPPSVGSEKLGIGLGYRNVTGAGDQITGSYSFSTTSGSSLLDLSYRYPFNPMNGTVQVRFAPSSYRITDPTFAAFGIRGTTDLYDITVRQPLIRSPREEFALSLGFTYQRGQTFLFNNIPQQFGVGPDANGVSTTSVLKFGQDYVSRDVQGAWALRSQFNVGLGIFGATSNADPVPDGSFFSWLLQGQRVQLLSPDQVLIVQADLQLSANTLLPSQQFVIGGGQSVRGFRQNVRSGDNGFRLSIEDRITVQRDESGMALVQLAPFLDLGTVWNTGGNPNVLQSQTFLAAIGVGFLWEPIPRLNIRLDYAIPFINLNDRGINVQDSAFYFSVNYGI